MHDQAVAIAQQTGRRVEEARRLGNLAEALVMNNQFGEALESLKQGLQIDDEIGYVRGKSYKYCSLAGVHLFMGDLAAARAAAEMACACDAPQNNHNSQVLLGLIALRQGDTDVALVAFEQCVTLAEELLQHNPQNYDALNSRGLAYSGLALLKRANPDTEYVQAATEAYRAARGINRAAGLVSHSLRLFEELAVMDTGRVLVAVRDVVAQSDA
jgi:tetratricopeptide (TPR) repeat protein